MSSQQKQMSTEDAGKTTINGCLVPIVVVTISIVVLVLLVALVWLLATGKNNVNLMLLLAAAMLMDGAILWSVRR